MANNTYKDSDSIIASIIINIVGNYFNLKAGYEFSKSRKKDNVYHKYICMYLIKENSTNLSFEKIGDYFNMTHCIVIHAHKKITDYLSYDKTVKNQIQSIQSFINKKLDSLTNKEYDNNYQVINLNSFTSINLNSNKYIVCVNIDENDIDKIELLFADYELKTRIKRNTGLYLCESLINKTHD